jgi:hypothetical protein
MKYLPSFIWPRRGWIVAFLIVVLMGCTASWELLTPDQKARATIDTFQVQLNDLFDQGKAYVDMHPEHLEAWQTEIIPVFDMANKALADSIELAKLEKIGPRDVQAKLMPIITRVMMYLDTIGVFE